MGKVLGMGNALVDILTRMDNDSLLKELQLPKGSMQLVDNEMALKILKQTNHLSKQKASGGSAANIIHGLASLGVPTGFLGKIGNDEVGEFFLNDMVQNHINPVLHKSKNSTGQAIALISPDSERTFATFLGAAVELSELDISDDDFKSYDYLHIEGYLVQNRALIRKAVETAKKCNLTVSLDLASYNVVEHNLEFLKEITERYVDILFANEEEAKAFTGKIDVEALNEMASSCRIAILKQGPKGSLIQQGSHIDRVGVIKAKSIDTTGAGDLYAAGFLYGLINKYPLSKCGQIGAILSGHVIEIIGSKMNLSIWDKIKIEIEEL
jgi:sugar/nucleoside kinase (ribokinase family)